MEPENSFRCAYCDKLVPAANKEIHSVRCEKKNLKADLSREISTSIRDDFSLDDDGNQPRSSSSAQNSKKTPQNYIDITDSPSQAISSNASTSQSDSTSLLELWRCQDCTYLNEISRSHCLACSSMRTDRWRCLKCTVDNPYTTQRCHMCGGNKSGASFISRSAQLLDDREGPSDTADIISTNWSCSKCTFLNQIQTTNCEVCGTQKAGSGLSSDIGEYVPPPIPSYMDRLVDPSFAHMQSFPSDAILHSDQENCYRDSSYSNNSHSNNSIRSNNLMLSGALLGAIVGSGSAFLNNRSVLEGASFGAAAGGIGGFLLDQQESNPSNRRTMSVQSRGQRRQRDWRPMNPPRGSRSRYAAGNIRSRGVGNSEEELINMIMFGQLDPMFQNSVSGSINIDNMSYDELYDRFGGPSQIPASSATINSLPSEILVKIESNMECSICLDQMKIGDEVSTLPCLHRYHKICSERWLQQSGKCPICKLNV